jgi:putative OPT family oligopeptide transporter
MATPLLAFLDQGFTIGGPKLLAPQASMFATMSRGLFVGGESLPWGMVVVGVGLGLVLIVVGQLLKKLKSSFSVSPMAVAVGIYLPFTTTLPILIGGLAHLWLTVREKDPARLAKALQTGTVLCAGLVAGEALTGIFLAIPIGFDVSLPVALIEAAPLRSVLSLVVLLGLPVLLYRAMRVKVA